MSNKFKVVVDSMGFRFPISRISKDLQYSKGAVSEFYNGKKELSENFIELFNNFYEVDLHMLMNNTQVNTSRIGERLNKLIKKHDLTQRDFATRVGVTEQSIGNYISNRRTPPVDVLLRMKQEFQFSLDWLLAGEEKQERVFQESPAVYQRAKPLEQDHAMISFLKEQIQEKDLQLKEKDTQIKRLWTLINPDADKRVG